jgi:hypothetical protein
MIKGTSQNILCNNCSRIINDTTYAIVEGKKGVLHYCHDDLKKCTPIHHQNKMTIYGKRNSNTQAN